MPAINQYGWAPWYLWYIPRTQSVCVFRFTDGWQKILSGGCHNKRGSSAGTCARGELKSGFVLSTSAPLH